MASNITTLMANLATQPTFTKEILSTVNKLKSDGGWVRLGHAVRCAKKKTKKNTQAIVFTKQHVRGFPLVIKERLITYETSNKKMGNFDNNIQFCLLMENDKTMALKYSPEKGSVQFSGKIHPDTLKGLVEDFMTVISGWCGVSIKIAVQEPKFTMINAHFDFGESIDLRELEFFLHANTKWRNYENKPSVVRCKNESLDYRIWVWNSGKACVTCRTFSEDFKHCEAELRQLYHMYKNSVASNIVYSNPCHGHQKEML